jgi:hypothetical protein
MSLKATKKKVYTGLVEFRPDTMKKQNARKGIREKNTSEKKNKKTISRKNILPRAVSFHLKNGYICVN